MLIDLAPDEHHAGGGLVAKALGHYSLYSASYQRSMATLISVSSKAIVSSNG